MIEKKILFICMGNICRSPAAEGVLRTLAEKDPAINLEIDSAGTLDYHAGECADPRMIKHAAKRGYDITPHRARQFDPDLDFKKYDYILTMDENNYYEIAGLDKTGEFGNKLYKVTSFSGKYKDKEVPDPYYGGSKAFELVLDILEDSCNGLIREIKNESANKK